MRTIASILDGKGRDVWTVPPDATVRRALEVMADKNVGALVVMDEDEVVGIISERDYARRVELGGKRAADVAVSDIMTSTVITVDPQQRAESCLTLMTDRRVRHLPVLSDGTVVGLVSIGDIVKAVISDLSDLVDQLEGYIQGR